MRWMLLVVLCASGCDLFFDANSVVYQPSALQDMADDADMPDTEPDLVEDMMADIPEDMPEDLPVDSPADMPDLPDTYGQICEEGGLIFGECDPIIQDCTEEGEGCIQLFSPTQMTLVNACGPADAFLLEEGTTCQAQDKCMPGLICRGTCKRMCDRSTGRGCTADEFCRVFDSSFGFGFCDVSC